MLEKITRFMMGRYGFDKFNLVMLVFALVLSMLSTLFGQPILMVLYFAVIGYTIFRTLSKNIEARRKEYFAFLKLWTPVEKWFTIKKKAFDDRKSFTYFKCPNCSQQLRAPKGRGKIKVTCQRCKKQFTKKV